LSGRSAAISAFMLALVLSGHSAAPHCEWWPPGDDGMRDLPLSVEVHSRSPAHYFSGAKQRCLCTRKPMRRRCVCASKIGRRQAPLLPNFMTGRVRMLMDTPEPLEKQRQLLYICQNGHLPRVVSGVGDRGPVPRQRRRSHLVRGVGFGPTSHRSKRGVLPFRRAPRRQKPIAGRCVSLRGIGAAALLLSLPPLLGQRAGGSYPPGHNDLHFAIVTQPFYWRTVKSIGDKKAIKNPIGA
jgi:hypothetical protein